MNINLHIERLVLDGLPVGSDQGVFVKSAVEAELSRLLATDGLNPDFQSGGAVPSVKADGVRMTNDSHPADLGRQIAQSVYGGIGK
jgi:hypothetical protein